MFLDVCTYSSFVVRNNLKLSWDSFLLQIQVMNPIVCFSPFQFAAILLLVFVTECVVVVLGYIYRAKVSTGSFSCRRVFVGERLLLWIQLNNILLIICGCLTTAGRRWGESLHPEGLQWVQRPQHGCSQSGYWLCAEAGEEICKIWRTFS